MPVQNRTSLKSFFKTGFKPTEQNFADLIDSYINLDNDFSGGDLSLSQGIRLSDTSNNQAGTIRFNTSTNQFEGHNGTSFGPLGGGGSSSPWNESGGDLTYSGGNVGIGTGGAPGFLLDIAPNTNEVARIGRALVGGRQAQVENYGGTTTTINAAWFGNANRTNVDEYGIIHDSSGNLRLNIDSSATLVFAQDGAEQMTMFNGKFSIGAFPDIAHSSIFQVTGGAAKTSGATWGTLSDKRLKKNIKDFKDGLKVLKDINPVWFEYNGKMGMPEGDQQVGLIAQDVQKTMPEMVETFKGKLDEKTKKETELLSLDINPLIYIMVNAIKELSAKIEKLEAK